MSESDYPGELARASMRCCMVLAGVVLRNQHPCHWIEHTEAPNSGSRSQLLEDAWRGGCSDRRTRYGLRGIPESLAAAYGDYLTLFYSLRSHPGFGR